MNPLFTLDYNNQRINITDPKALPKASSFYWNKKLLVQVNCLGFVSSQFLQPEPSKYSYSPVLEQQTFMQPEMEYFSDYPGRFIFIKDNDNGKFFSVPYEPVKAKVEYFNCSMGKSDIRWKVRNLDLEVNLIMTLSENDVVEFWSVDVKNLSSVERNISIYTYFTIGYMSWMNQSAAFIEDANSIVAKSVRPYQKTEDYEKNKKLSSSTFLMSEKSPCSYCASKEGFIGGGSLHSPEALSKEMLTNDNAYYQTPVAALQFKIVLEPKDKFSNRLLFGSIRNESELVTIKNKYFDSSELLTKVLEDYRSYTSDIKGCIELQSPNRSFDEFVNHWLPRQIYYHGELNRLTSDPQTRNYLQDAMGMTYLKPQTTKKAILRAASQQHYSGEMPDGILMHSDAVLKYINQVPHTDHCVWLPIVIKAYLSETNDLSILKETIAYKDSDVEETLYQHVNKALEWLNASRNESGLNLIGQGDWCDPMNMVGIKGKGVSSWLSLATSFALLEWAKVCRLVDKLSDSRKFHKIAEEINLAVNKYCWDKEWYARGITDDGNLFGTQKDEEGKIYLNPQSWSLMSGAADPERKSLIINSVDKYLKTPFGNMMLSPSYTEMREDIGRITQKHPGVAENGSVYNHAAIFYAYALYQHEEHDRAFEVLLNMIPSAKSESSSGQVANYIPNYYRGAYHQIPSATGRSSHLIHTGTVAWYYRCLVEELCGLKGKKGALIIQPKLPSNWPFLNVKRNYLGVSLELKVKRSESCRHPVIKVNGKWQKDNKLRFIEKGKEYKIEVILPQGNKEVSD